MGTNSTRIPPFSGQNFMYCEPPNGNWVNSVSFSARYSGIPLTNCQFRKLRFRFALSSFCMSSLPRMAILTGPAAGINSFIARAEKSTQPSANIGCTTLEAPSNVAPPGASSPRPVRRRPSSCCSSRFLRASLSFSTSSSKSEAIEFKVNCESVFARLS